MVNYYNPSASRASSNFDLRYMLNIGYVYDMPCFKQPRLSHTLPGGWQFSGITSWHTGTPYSVDYPDTAGVANGIGTGSYPESEAQVLSSSLTFSDLSEVILGTKQGDPLRRP